MSLAFSFSPRFAVAGLVVIGVLGGYFVFQEQLPLHFTRAVSLQVGVNNAAPLTGMVQVTTNLPSKLEVRVVSEDNEWNLSSRGFAKKHELSFLGLDSGTYYPFEVDVVATGLDGSVIRNVQPVAGRTSSLPESFPPIEVTVSDPDEMEPGITLFNVLSWNGADMNRDYGLIVAVDEVGDVVWYYKADHMITDVKMLSNGNILYMYGHMGAKEIDVLGNVVHHWYPTGITDPPEDAIAVATDRFHHDIIELPNGNFSTLSTEVREYEDYPSSDTDPSAGKVSANVVGDVIVEFTRSGEVVQEISLLDILDPYRIGYNSLNPLWDPWGYKEKYGNTKDWSHGNAIEFDETDNSYIVSLRHQDAVVKISRADGDVEWILGDRANWSSEFRSKILRTLGSVELPYHQHAPMLTENGTLLMFDNGNYKTVPFYESISAEDNYSRAVEYRINESVGTVEQVWAYGGPHDQYYSPFLGDADELPATGNVLVTDGGKAKNEEGIPTDNIPQGHKWSRVVEVTRDEDPRVVFEMVLDGERPDGWSVYRSERIPSL